MNTHSISRSTYADYVREAAPERVHWEGQAATRLGIEGAPVTKESFACLSEAVDPTTGEVLRTRPRVKYTREVEGKTRVLARPVAVYDSIIRASKTVSILAVVDERISEAHALSVGDVAPWLESYAGVQVRGEGIRVTGNTIYSRWNHHSNRSLDPCEHTHIPTMNLTWDPERQRWYAVAVYSYYQGGEAAQQMYQERMTERLQFLGYRMEENQREVAGVSARLIERFSQREREVETMREAWQVTYGTAPSDRNMDFLVARWRGRKEELSLAALRERQLERLTSGERQGLVEVRERAGESQGPVEVWRPRPYQRVETIAPPLREKPAPLRY
jgi:conjugative relaxase-like TrwC/TraI family protein